MGGESLAGHTGNFITNRQQLYNYLHDVMISNYSKYRTDRKLYYEGSQVKTYLLESEVLERTGAITQEFILETFCEQEKPIYNIKLLPTEEDGFYAIDVGRGNQSYQFYLDTTTNKRFWLGFSTGKSTYLDRWLSSVISNSSLVDNSWFWPEFLESIQSYGEPRGFGLDYDNRVLSLDEENAPYLKMQLWGGASTREFYEKLKRDDVFGRNISLSKVRFKQETEEKEIFAIQDVKYNGKFTVRGTSWAVHLGTLSNVREEYSKYIIDIEKKYRINYSENKGYGFHVEGFPIHITSLQGVEFPLETMKKKMFDGSEPFKLIGLINSQSEHHVNLEVVDRHTGDAFYVDCYPDLITLYLGPETCGNTLARFKTNLARHLRIDLKVEADNGELLLK